MHDFIRWNNGEPSLVTDSSLDDYDMVEEEYGEGEFSTDESSTMEHYENPSFIEL